ncbi:uncharacterized protein LOC132695787 [Cylas formicarius]|uniref:uncharacterized protein LOC132695787 n=1 Tax=Cylas formicarius TaxID=197179 RepID=UPI0029584782|nr:uncharacterized protein LOC132695787 [Cylas formicarius]
MTVIRGNKNYNFSKPCSSTTASDTESLHLDSASASDAESYIEPNSSNRIYRPLSVRSGFEDDAVHLKKASGKKKLRRFENRCQLHTLSEDDEDNAMVVMEYYKSPFARLLEDADAMKYWNMFVEKTEEEQENIINVFSKQCNKSGGTQILNEISTGKISTRFKRSLKIRKKLSIDAIKCCEDNLLMFFNSNTTGSYIKSPNNSFERLLINAIAHYHGLEFKNIPPSGAGEKRSVEIFNKNENWLPANCFLTDFIRQLR